MGGPTPGQRPPGVVERFSNGLCTVQAHTLSQLYLRTLFMFFFSGLPPGGPGEGPVIDVFLAISARIRWTIYSMLRTSASGPEIGFPGRILAGLLPGKQ